MATDKFRECAAQAAQSIDRLIKFRVDTTVQRAVGNSPDPRALEMHAGHIEEVTRALERMQLEALRQSLLRMV